MGASASSHSQSSHPPSRALHVLRVTPSSPASESDIEPFFDFIVGIDGHTHTSSIDATSLERIVEAHEGKTLSLLVWSSKARSTRMVAVTPSREWSQSNLSGHAQPSLLGLSMRVCEPETALDNVWHVLEVLEGSPAESAGLVPYGDWIIGWSGGALGSEGAFYDVVEAHVDKPLRVYVYSADFDTLREVVLVPNRQWGGDGLLGCGVGFGLLHRIPPPSELPSAEELLQDMQLDEESHDLFIPADSDVIPNSAGFGLSTYEHADYFQSTSDPQALDDLNDSHGHSHGYHGHVHDHHEHQHNGHSHEESDGSNGHHKSLSPLPSHSTDTSPLFTAVPPSQTSFSTTSTFAPRAIRTNGIDNRPITPGSTPGRNRSVTPRKAVTDEDDQDDDGTSIASDSRAEESGSITSVD